MESVVASYVNLVNNPPVLFFAIILAILYTEEHIEGEEGLLERYKYKLGTLAQSEPVPFFKAIYGLIHSLLGIVVNHKLKFILIGLSFVPALVKRSTKNFIGSTILAVVILVMSSEKDYDIDLYFFIANAWFLMCTLRNPKYKFAIGIIAVFVFIYWGDVIKPSYVKPPSTTLPTPPATKPSTPPGTSLRG